MIFILRSLQALNTFVYNEKNNTISVYSNIYWTYLTPMTCKNNVCSNTNGTCTIKPENTITCAYNNKTTTTSSNGSVVT